MFMFFEPKVAPNISFACRVCHNYKIIFHDDSLSTSSVQATVPAIEYRTVRMQFTEVYTSS